MAQRESESMEHTSSQQPVLCKAGCGFFANTGCDSLCSKCHRDMAAKADQQQQAEAALAPAALKGPVLTVFDGLETAPSASAASTDPPAASSNSGPPEAAATAAAAAAAAGTSAVAAPGGPPAPQQAPTRCQLAAGCRKKVGLTGYKCKCGLIFCGPHRLAEVHNCSFDYKAAGRLQLAENNPLVVGDKVHKI